MSIHALTCTSCSVCWCSSSKIGKVCSAVQCSRIRWITLQPYGWVESTNTLKTGLQIEVKPIEAHISCDTAAFKMELNIPTTIKKTFCLPRPEFHFQQKSGKDEKASFCVSRTPENIQLRIQVHYNIFSLHNCKGKPGSTTLS